MDLENNAKNEEKPLLPKEDAEKAVPFKKGEDEKPIFMNPLQRHEIPYALRPKPQVNANPNLIGPSPMINVEGRQITPYALRPRPQANEKANLNGPSPVANVEGRQKTPYALRPKPLLNVEAKPNFLSPQGNAKAPNLIGPSPVVNLKGRQKTPYEFRPRPYMNVGANPPNLVGPLRMDNVKNVLDRPSPYGRPHVDAV